LDLDIREDVLVLLRIERSGAGGSVPAANLPVRPLTRG